MAATRPLTVKEVCYLLNKDRSTVQRWKAQGLPFVAGQISREALAAWLAENKGYKPRPASGSSTLS